MLNMFKPGISLLPVQLVFVFEFALSKIRYNQGRNWRVLQQKKKKKQENKTVGCPKCIGPLGVPSTQTDNLRLAVIFASARQRKRTFADNLGV
jgi:hypothetical protein